MTALTLYLFVGYPGAGKTTVAKLIASKNGAAHIWADNERHKLFNMPTHSKQESDELYEHLNKLTDELLSDGKSVVYDTNFNFRRDRDHLREIASKYGAKPVVVWLNTPKETAKQRAVHDANLRNGYQAVMTPEHFDEITAKLEPPAPDENAVIIDGSNLDLEQVKHLLGL